MTCVHLRQLYTLCKEQDLKFSTSDLLHVVCGQCEREEVCPSVFTDEYEAENPDSSDEARGKDDSKSDQR